LSPLEIGGLSLFILVMLFGIFSIPFGLPGSIIILADAFLYATVTRFEAIGPRILITLLVLAILAESADVAAGMAGAVKFGISRRGLWAFLFGGICGAFLLTPLLLGLGLIVGIFLGGFSAFLIVELLKRNRLKPSLRVPAGAILARVAGICVKGFFALIMVIITLTGVYS
jgi:uncharacterized protein YqgC (DUF456 family)